MENPKVQINPDNLKRVKNSVEAIKRNLEKNQFNCAFLLLEDLENYLEGIEK